jgi:hypothetical protein
MAISTLAELESHCSRIHKDSIFSAGIVSVALGLFLPTNKESGEVWFHWSLILPVLADLFSGCTRPYCAGIYFSGVQIRPDVVFASRQFRAGQSL